MGEDVEDEEATLADDGRKEPDDVLGISVPDNRSSYPGFGVLAWREVMSSLKPVSRARAR